MSEAPWNPHPYAGDPIETQTFGPLPDVAETLKERGERYGDFAEHARITQDIKRAMIGSPNWQSLKDYQRESLEMLAHKIGRILNGDPDYLDSWVDIEGYTRLVVERLPKEGS